MIFFPHGHLYGTPLCLDFHFKWRRRNCLIRLLLCSFFYLFRDIERGNEISSSCLEGIVEHSGIKHTMQHVTDKDCLKRILRPLIRRAKKSSRVIFVSLCCFPFSKIHWPLTTTIEIANETKVVYSSGGKTVQWIFRKLGWFWGLTCILSHIVDHVIAPNNGFTTHIFRVS